MMFGPLAYMDPGSGSLFLQLLLGGVAGLAVVVKLFWHRVLSLLGLARDQAPEDADLKPEETGPKS